MILHDFFLLKNTQTIHHEFSEWGLYSSHWLNCRWTPTVWELRRTWVTLFWWRLRRRNTGCTMTGTASTSRSRPQLETTWNSPASAGWWVTRKWCCGMDKVVIESFVQTTKKNDKKTPNCWSHLFHQSGCAVQKRKPCSFILCLLQHFCPRTIRPSWSSSTDKKSWIRGEKHSGKFTLPTAVKEDAALDSTVSFFFLFFFRRWKEWQPGFPMSIAANRHRDLPRDIQFDSEKGADFILNYSKAYVQPCETGLQWLWCLLMCLSAEQRSATMQFSAVKSPPIPQGEGILFWGQNGQMGQSLTCDLNNSHMT